MSTVQPILGLFVFLGITFFLSKNRAEVSALRVAIGLVAQVIIAMLLLKVSVISSALMGLMRAVSLLVSLQ